MAHPFTVREIARQSGLSEATVDRVLHGRGGVRESTAAEVRRAIEELGRQRAQVRLTGQTFLVDVVIDAPARFATAVRAALESQLPGIRPAVFRSRFHLSDAAPVEALVAALHRVAVRGSHGIILTAPDHPDVIGAVEMLARQGIPVITFASDLPTSARTAYVGLDNRAAGATAAYLLEQLLRFVEGPLLVTRGDSGYRGEDEREMGFRSTLRFLSPGRRQIDVVNADLDGDIQRRFVRDALSAEPVIAGVYSMYAFAGNHPILAAFEEAGRPAPVFVAHDLDADNLALLRARRLTMVLHHDLARDMRHACEAILHAHGALPGPPRSCHSSVEVITPFNVPAGAAALADDGGAPAASAGHRRSRR